MLSAHEAILRRATAHRASAAAVADFHAIVLHQILQWHHMPTSAGIVDQHLLGLHHVKETATNPLLWDLGFLAFGAALVVVGVSLSRHALRRAEIAEPGMRRVA